MLQSLVSQKYVRKLKPSTLREVYAYETMYMWFKDFEKDLDSVPHEWDLFVLYYKLQRQDKKHFFLNDFLHKPVSDYNYWYKSLALPTTTPRLYLLAADTKMSYAFIVLLTYDLF